MTADLFDRLQTIKDRCDAHLEKRPSNPWVWVLTFAVHHANVDAVLAQRAEVAA